MNVEKIATEILAKVSKEVDDAIKKAMKSWRATKVKKMKDGYQFYNAGSSTPQDMIIVQKGNTVQTVGKDGSKSSWSVRDFLKKWR